MLVDHTEVHPTLHTFSLATTFRTARLRNEHDRPCHGGRVVELTAFLTTKKVLAWRSRDNDI